MDPVLITKIISALVYPMGLVFLLIVVQWVARVVGAKNMARLMSLLAVAIIFISSNPKFSRWLAFQLERQYPQQIITDIAMHDAIIVLGGGVRIPVMPARHTQLGAGSDRYWYAARLYHAGKAPKVILAGGNVFSQTGLEGEAYYARQLLEEWGVPRSAILIEANSRTTEENQRNTALFLVRNGVESALLVTSALHMPRAHRLFSQLPVPMTPASADVLIRKRNKPAVMDWLPSASAMQLTTLALHEYYGVWFNELKVFTDKL